MASTRRLAAIFAVDVAGYSRLMGADEEGTHESIFALRSAKDPQESTMKRVKGVENLNIGMIRAQGIVGVGPTIRTLISSFPAAACRPTVSTGLPAGPAFFSPSRCSHVCSAVCSWNDSWPPTRLGDWSSSPIRPA